MKLLKENMPAPVTLHNQQDVLLKRSKRREIYCDEQRRIAPQAAVYCWCKRSGKDCIWLSGSYTIPIGIVTIGECIYNYKLIKANNLILAV